MKVFLFILFCFVSFGFTAQQGLFLKGATILNVNQDNIYVTGEIVVDTNYLSTTDSKILNTGSIFLTQDFKNNTSTNAFWNDSSGKVVFNGAAVQSITGGGLNFYSLTVDNTSGLLLNDTIVIRDSLILENGSIDINGSQIRLFNNINGTVGEIVGESNINYIYGAGSIYTQRVVISGGNIAGMGLRLAPNTLGDTKLFRYHQIVPNVADGSIGRYYILTPTTVDTVVTDFNYLQHEIAGLNESDFDIFHSMDSVWWKRQFATPNFATDSVFGGNIPFSTGENFLTISEYFCDTPPAISFASDTMYRCGADSLLLQTNLPNSLSFKWSNNNSDSAQYVQAAGNYTVEVWSPEGCYSIDSVVVIDQNNPYAAFSVPVMTCLGNVTEFQAIDSLGMEPISTYQWHLGDPLNTIITTSVDSLLYTYTVGDSLDAQLIVTSAFGCQDSVMHRVLVDSIPAIGFSFLDVCEGNAVVFSNLSAANGLGSAISLNAWNFGDGNTATTSNVSHVYSLPGTYNVELIITENTGCKDTLVQTVNVNPNPTTSFTANQVCERTATDFINTSTGASTYQWSFESANQSTVTNPSYVFSSNGVFNVQLLGTSTFGCVNSITLPITVDLSPVADFNFTDTCAQSISIFNNNSVDTISVCNYNWSFGDGATATSENPIHTYIGSGNFNVELVVLSGNGCMDSVTHIFNSFVLPVSAFSFADVCEDSTVSFSNSSTIAAGSIAAQNWDFGNGSISSLVNPTASYNNDTVYPVTLISISNNGCRDTVLNNITIYNNPVVNLGGSVSTCGTSLSLNAGNAGSNYLWSTTETTQTISVSADGDYHVTVTTPFGCHDEDTVSVLLNIVAEPNLGNDTTVCDRIVLNAFSPAATYSWSTGSVDSVINVSASGTYWVDRIDQNGCLGSDTIIVVVNASPIVNLGLDQSVCDGNSVTMDASNSGLDFLWNNGLLSQVITTDTSGVFEVVVTDPLTNCFGQDTIEVNVNPLPILNLGNDTTVCDSYFISELGYSSYLWQDGSMNNSFTVLSTGLYWLEVTNSFSCSARDSINVTSFSTPILSLGQDTIVCNGNSLILDAGIATNYLWNTLETSSQIIVTSAGQYFVEASNGICTANDSIQVGLDSIWQIDLGPDTSFCIGNSVVIRPNYNSGLDFEWNNQTTLIGVDDSLDVNSTGVYSVVSTNGNGCESRDTIVVNVFSIPVTAEFLMPSNVYTGDTVNFVSVSVDSNLSYQWNFGNNVTTNEQNPQYTYFVIGDYDVTLQVSNGGCVDSIVKTILVGAKSFNWHHPVSIYDESSSLLDMILYPNPNDGTFTLGVFTRESIDLEYSILDLNGRMIYNHHTSVDGALNIDLQINDIESGTYIVVVRSGIEFLSRLFIKM